MAGDLSRESRFHWTGTGTQQTLKGCFCTEELTKSLGQWTGNTQIHQNLSHRDSKHFLDGSGTSNTELCRIQTGPVREELYAWLEIAWDISCP